jgi:2-oxoisovalerate dehydrogenase E2 component (dihydrolipoyl transacylase)
MRGFAVLPFKLPDIGEGIAEVQVMEWFVKEGDKIKEMDRLCLVESDKASVEITSRYSGVIKSILVPALDQAKVGTVIVEIDDGVPVADESKTSSERTQPEQQKPSGKSSASLLSVEPSPRIASIPAVDEIKASPPVRSLAKSLKVDLSKVRGTGKDGRITEQDVVRESQSREGMVSGKEGKLVESMEMYGPSKEVKLSQVGQAMVKMMNSSLKVPQLTHSDEIDCDQLLEIVKELKPIAKSEFNLSSLTLTSFFIKAVSLGMTEYPIINSRMASEESQLFSSTYYLLENHNVSVAMDSPRGLVVPNIKNVEKKTLVEIQKDLIDLHARAKAGRLSFEDIKGGTVSFSNIGVIGGTYTKPVIFDGQAVIGAIGKIVQVPKFTDLNAIVPKRIVNVSWTADHRHVDGATVARFSNAFKFWIENPSELIALHFK